MWDFLFGIFTQESMCAHTDILSYTMLNTTLFTISMEPGEWLRKLWSIHTDLSFIGLKTKIKLCHLQKSGTVPPHLLFCIINQNKDEYTKVFLRGRIKDKSKTGKKMDYQEINYTNMKYICTNLIRRIMSRRKESQWRGGRKQRGQKKPLKG